MTCPDLSSSLVSIGYAVRTNQQEGAAQRSNDTKLSHHWRATFAAELHIELILKLDIGTASGWLERLVRSRPLT